MQVHIHTHIEREREFVCEQNQCIDVKMYVCMYVGRYVLDVMYVM